MGLQVYVGRRALYNVSTIHLVGIQYLSILIKVATFHSALEGNLRQIGQSENQMKAVKQQYDCVGHWAIISN